jgi:predicted ATP-grasp superfamily ATP-dependent carboligase/ribosomal protein S18 acetylase RimI-like enzyme
MCIEDIDAVVDIHRRCFSDQVSLFSVLHPKLAWHLYAQYVEEKDSLGVVLVDETLGFVAGYAAGTLKPGIQRRFLKRHWFLVGWYLLLGIAVHPSLIGRVVRALFKKERFEEYRRHPELFETTYPAGPVGYFMPIAVHPDYRGGGNAVRVARALMEEFFKRGVVRIRGNKIDIHNLASQKLFVDKLGWNSVVIENESVVVWVDKPEAAGPGEAPACPVRRTLPPLPSVFITYGWCRSSYAILFSLGRRGVKVHVGDASPLAMSRFSRYAASFSRLPDFFVEPERYIDCLLEALKKTGAEILLASHEDVGLVSRYRERFPEHIRMAVPAWESYQAAEDKLRLMEIASQYGCPVPRTYAAAEGELEKLSKELAFPVVLKTRIGNSAKGVAIAHHAEELKEKYRFLADTYHLAGERLPFLQEFLPGRAAGVCAVYDHGRPLAFFAEEYLRCKEPGRFGTSTLRRTLEEPALVESGRRVLDGLKWHGPVHLDFIQDAEGVYRLIELNPRPWGAMALAIYAGVDFPWLWYRLAAGENLTFTDIKPAKIMCRWILGDFLALSNRLRNGLWGEAAQILRWHSGCYHDDFTWTDPFPFFAQNLDYLVKYIKAGGRMNPVTKNMVR